MRWLIKVSAALLPDLSAPFCEGDSRQSPATKIFLSIRTLFAIAYQLLQAVALLEFRI